MSAKILLFVRYSQVISPRFILLYSVAGFAPLILARSLSFVIPKRCGKFAFLNTRCRMRYERLGVEDIYMKCDVKIRTWEAFLKKYNMTAEEVIYVGDDIPDYEIMQQSGCPCCPADACTDIKAIARYVSDRNGGEGCGRDIIEQVLRAQGKWLSDERAFGW